VNAGGLHKCLNIFHTFALLITLFLLKMQGIPKETHSKVYVFDNQVQNNMYRYQLGTNTFHCYFDWPVKCIEYGLSCLEFCAQANMFSPPGVKVVESNSLHQTLLEKI
jgi:hypothetical protein